MNFGTKTEIALARPFKGIPKINLPSIIGASPKKPILIRIATTGARPIDYEVKNLPDGLFLDGNIIRGEIEKNGSYEIEILAKNPQGVSKKAITLEIFDQNVLVTPLLGFTSWNAFAQHVTQNDIEAIADRLVSLGISEYGYNYVNTDSGWQGEYGGELDAIMPNKKFPDIKKMTDKIHSLGLKCGIYSTPMLNAWGCPDDLPSIPGCTQGEPDHRFPDTNGGIGVIHKEENNAKQFAKWGFDYLKYDWGPVTDTVNADLMRRELIKLDRDFGFCVTVCAPIGFVNYFSKYCSSYRNNPDTLANFENLKKVYESYFDYRVHMKKGHYFDLDMLDFGTCRLHTMWNILTNDEKIIQFSIRAFLSSPIQISSTLERADDFELSVYCNEEVLKISQDCAFKIPEYVKQINEEKRYLHILEKELEDEKFAYMLLNLGEVEEEIAIEKSQKIYDVWAKRELKSAENSFTLYPHTVRILKTDEKIKF